MAFSIGLFAIINIAAKVFPFLLLPILTYYLRPDQFGESALFISACSLLIPIVGLRGDAILVYVMGEKSGHLQGDARVGVAMYAPWIMATALVLLLIAGVIAGFPIKEKLGISAPWLLIAVFTAVFTYYLVCVNVLWQFSGEMKRFAGMQFAQASAVLVVTAALVIGPLPEAAGRNIGYSLPPVILGLWSLRKLSRVYGLRSYVGVSAIQSFCRIALPLLGGTAAHILAGTVDRYAIAWYSGPSAVGIYAFGITLGGVMAVVAEAVDLAWVPYVAKSLRKPNHAGSLILAAFIIIGILSAVAVAYCLILPAVIDLMAQSTAYKDALPIAMATVFAVICKASFNLLSALSLYGGEHRFGLVVNLSLAVLIPIGILEAASTMSLAAPQFAIGAAYAIAALAYLANLMRTRK